MSVRNPQIRITVGGAVVPGVICAEVERVAYFAAARFTITVALAGATGLDRNFFAAVGAKVVTIEAAAEPFGFHLLLSGQVDNVVDDLKAGTISLYGRDLSARLIDSEIAETFANQTSSQVATIICGRHGLTANVTATTIPVGQYYDLDHARSVLGLNSRGGTEWNLLSWLAIIEGFSLSVFGSALNFGNAPPAGRYVLTAAGCTSLQVDSLPSLPQGVIVKSWNTRQKTAVMQTFGDDAILPSTLIRPNLTTHQASKIAQNHQMMLNTHRTVLIASMPGEFSLAPGGMIELFGTKSSYDQTYVVDTVVRSVTAAKGFVQNVKAHAVT